MKIYTNDSFVKIGYFANWKFQKNYLQSQETKKTALLESKKKSSKARLQKKVNKANNAEGNDGVEADKDVDDKILVVKAK